MFPAALGRWIKSQHLSLSKPALPADQNMYHSWESLNAHSIFTERRISLSNSCGCNGIITLGCSIWAAFVVVLLLSCGDALWHYCYLRCRQQRGTDPQHVTDYGLVAQTSFCCSFTAETVSKIHIHIPTEKKKRNYPSPLTDPSVLCCSLWLAVKSMPQLLH